MKDHNPTRHSHYPLAFVRKIPGSIYGLVIITLIFSFFSPYFFSVSNFVNIVKQSSIITIIAICSFLAILIHGTDLSIGAIAGFVGVITANGIVAGIPPVLAAGIGMVCGMLFGAFNGILIAFTGVAPFIITLGTMGMGEGFSLVLAGGSTVRIQDSGFRILGDGLFLGFPISTFVAIGIYAVMSVFLYKRPFGTYLYAIGGSEETSIASGINVRSIKTRVYVLNGLFASIAGIILASRLGSANPSQGIGLELDGIAAAVLGGTSLSGGKGRVWGVFFGAVTMSILRNGLNMVGLPMALQVIVVGLILIAILSFDTLREIS